MTTRTRRLGATALAVALGLGACGGGGGGTIDGGGGGDGATADGGGDGGGGGALFPIAAGAAWTFQVTAVGNGAVCAPGSHEQRVVSADPVGGRDAFQMTSFCPAAGTGDYSLPGGDEVDDYYAGTWGVVVDPMLVEGHAWSYFNTSYHWHREGTVTVPLGSYDDCWTAVQDVSYTAYQTYCRGVGLVRSYSADLNRAAWDAPLDGQTRSSGRRRGEQRLEGEAVRRLGHVPAQRQPARRAVARRAVVGDLRRQTGAHRLGLAADQVDDRDHLASAARSTSTPGGTTRTTPVAEMRWTGSMTTAPAPGHDSST